MRVGAPCDRGRGNGRENGQNGVAGGLRGKDAGAETPFNNRGQLKGGSPAADFNNPPSGEGKGIYRQESKC